MEETRRLQKWFNDNQPDDEMLWKKSFQDQVMFVRDQVASVLSRSYQEYTDLVDVYSTHYSKSICCPVYFIDLKKDGVKIWMRYNFYDWNISVESEKPLDCDFLDTFDDEHGYGYCYCQGMEDKKFGRYRDNNKKFTVCIGGKFDVYTFCRVLRKHLGIKREDR